jgi:hypothetical protein
VYVKAEIYLDGGASASSTPAVVGNAGTLCTGPHDVPNIAIDAWGVHRQPAVRCDARLRAVQAAYVAELPGKVRSVDGRSLSEPPPGWRARVGKVGAVRAGADGTAEMLAELGMVFTDAGYRLADGAGHTGSGALGRGRGSSATTTQAKRVSELSKEEAAFGVGLRGPLGVPEGARLLDVVVDLGEASAVGVACDGLEPGCGDPGGHLAREPRWRQQMSAWHGVGHSSTAEIGLGSPAAGGCHPPVGPLVVRGISWPGSRPEW